MMLVSPINRLSRDKTVTKIVQEDFTFEEFKEVMLEKSPTAIYCLEYSNIIPCWYITKLIMPSHGGVIMYADSSVDKIPRLHTWEQFYRILKLCGLDTIRF